MFDLGKYLREKAESFASPSDFAEWVIAIGGINYTKCRNRAIREYYHSLKCTDRLDARIQTANHFCLSLDQVHSILYRRVAKKAHTEAV